MFRQKPAQKLVKNNPDMMKGDKTIERMVEQVQGQMLQELGVPVAPQIPQQPQGAMQNEQM